MKALRLSLGLTQAGMAESLGITHAIISRAESGTGLGAVTTRKICDRYRVEMSRLGLTAEDFLRGERWSGGSTGQPATETPATDDPREPDAA